MNISQTLHNNFCYKKKVVKALDKEEEQVCISNLEQQ